MEAALRNKLIQEIPELENQIYPTNAPETYKKPYLVYTRISTEKIKTLEGFMGKEYLSFMFSVMATKYGDMKELTKKIENLLESLPNSELGSLY